MRWLARDCASATGCVVMVDESTSPTDTSPTVLPAGHYFMVVTAAESDPAGACGDYCVQTNGVLPVQLQSFRVE